MKLLWITKCATVNNIIHRTPPQKKLVQGAASLNFTLHQERPTTACVLKSLSACASGWRFSNQPQAGTWMTAGCSWARGKWVLGSARRWGSEVFAVLYSSFCCSFFWKQTGKMESTARTPSTASEFQDTASPAVVSLYSVVPALIATKDGGATPRKVPMKKTPKGTLMTGEVMLMNQLGRKGVILRKMM